MLLFISAKWSIQSGLNRRPRPYQGRALPTVLWMRESVVELSNPASKLSGPFAPHDCFLVEAAAHVDVGCSIGLHGCMSHFSLKLHGERGADQPVLSSTCKLIDVSLPLTAVLGMVLHSVLGWYTIERRRNDASYRFRSTHTTECSTYVIEGIYQASVAAILFCEHICLSTNPTSLESTILGLFGLLLLCGTIGVSLPSAALQSRTSSSHHWPACSPLSDKVLVPRTDDRACMHHIRS